MDQKYMELAIELALKAKGRTSPNPMVGAVVVNKGQIVGQGFHEKAGTPHAEVNALRDAGALAEGATVYVTLEPCSHYGRTPPCVEALKAAKVAKVMVATIDPNPLVSGRGVRLLREAGIEVEIGLMEEKAKQMNRFFNTYITEKRPYIIAKAAMTLDGKIATRTGHSQWITSPPARERVHRLRDEVDGILVGIGTVLADNPALTTRLPGEGQDPHRIILDSDGRLPLEAQVINPQSEAKTILATTNRIPEERAFELERLGVEVLILPDQDGKIDLHALVKALGERQVSSLLVEGGAGVHASFFEAGLVDEVHMYIAPKIIGGQNAYSPVGGLGALTMKGALQLKNLTVEKIEEDILIIGFVEKGEALCLQV